MENIPTQSSNTQLQVFKEDVAVIKSNYATKEDLLYVKIELQDVIATKISDMNKKFDAMNDRMYELDSNMNANAQKLMMFIPIIIMSTFALIVMMSFAILKLVNG